MHLLIKLVYVPVAPPGALNVIIDSVDTLESDLGSTPKTYKFIRMLLGLITTRSGLFTAQLMSMCLLIFLKNLPSLSCISSHALSSN